MPENTKPVAISASKRPIPSNARMIVKSDPEQRIRVSIYARRNPRPPADVLRTLDHLSSALPGERRYLGDEEFNQVFGAGAADLQAIADWAKASNLSVVDASIPKRRVLLEGRIADMEHAFGVQLNEYEHPHHGQFRGRTQEIHVPAPLAGTIEGVFGLDTRRVGNPRRRRSRLAPQRWHVPMEEESESRARAISVARADLSDQFPGSFLPTEVAQLYSYPGDLDGANQNIAVFAFNGPPNPDPRGGYSLPALTTYFESVLGIKTPRITDIVVQGSGNVPGPDTRASALQGDSTGEVMLDLCVTGAVAPGANLFVYFTEFTSQGWLDAVHEAITDANGISVISISYGNPEDDPQSAWSKMGVHVVNQAFEAAKAKGITICCASGDDGSNDQIPSGAHVDFPASSPNVLAVGGTKLTATAGVPLTIGSETVWNEATISEGAGGGGVSEVFTKPDYQSSASVPPSANPPHRLGRGVPDVSAVADPQTGVIIMRIEGQQLEVIGGTSAAAPLWAALIARLNQGLNARCGFLNAILYGKFSAGVLRDITFGNNGAYSAGPGWDPCTGLGSPQGQGLLAALAGKLASSAGR